MAGRRSRAADNMKQPPFSHFRDTFTTTISLSDGSHLVLIAHRKGYPISEPYGRMLVPPTLDLVYDVFRFLRYWLLDFGAWVLEARTETDSPSGASPRQWEYKNRRAAWEGLHELAGLARHEGESAIFSFHP